MIAKQTSVCLVAILKDEEPFLDEWILYHRMLGIDHFFLYDDHPAFPLQDFLKCHEEYVTVIPWHGQDVHFEGVNTQTKAYFHAVQHGAGNYVWAAFLDGDEFIVLRHHDHIKDFLAEFADRSAVSLNWHLFGHNGFFDDPQGLVTASLTRRKFQASRNVKTIAKVAEIEGMYTPHHCKLKGGLWVDANNRIFTFDHLYLGKTERAHINHYHCRSFARWMRRADRGDACFNSENGPSEWHWKLDKAKCLEKFVATVACDHNEYVDEYLLKYQDELEQQISKCRLSRGARNN